MVEVTEQTKKDKILQFFSVKQRTETSNDLTTIFDFFYLFHIHELIQ